MEAKSDTQAPNERVSRHKMVSNAKSKFYENLTQIYKDNKSAPVLAPPKKTVKKVPVQKPVV